MTNNKFFKLFTKYQSTLINIGASIVIIGLIFKINHYKMFIKGYQFY